MPGKILEAKLWKPDWINEAVGYAKTIATPKCRESLEATDIRFYDCTGSKRCQDDDKPSRNNWAHAHNGADWPCYGKICIFRPEILQDEPTYSGIHEIAHLTVVGGHNNAWMKRYKQLLAYFGFNIDPKHREVVVWGHGLQTASQWNSKR